MGWRSRSRDLSLLACVNDSNARNNNSAARSGRYIVTVKTEDVPRVLKAIQTTKVAIKPQRRKRTNKK